MGVAIIRYKVLLVFSLFGRTSSNLEQAAGGEKSLLSNCSSVVFVLNPVKKNTATTK